MWHFATLIFYLAFPLPFFAPRKFTKNIYKLKKTDLFFQINIYIYIYIYKSGDLMSESIRFYQVEHSSFRLPPQQNYIYVNLIMYDISSLYVFLD